MEMAREVLPVAVNTPVLAGVNGTDPFCLFDRFLDEVKAVGFSGVQNFPTVGLIDGTFRANLEETGMRSEEHTSELQSLMRISYAVFCLKTKKNTKQRPTANTPQKL